MFVYEWGTLYHHEVYVDAVYINKVCCIRLAYDDAVCMNEACVCMMDVDDVNILSMLCQYGLCRWYVYQWRIMEMEGWSIWF